MNFLDKIGSPSVLGVILVSIVVVTVLLVVIYIQNRKLKDMKRPKYGFLGKPLALVAISLIGVSIYGIGINLNQSESTEFVSVSADREITLSIEARPGESKGEYVLNAIPIVDGSEWGHSDKSNTDYKFDIYWTFSGRGNVNTEVEFDRNYQEPSQITRLFESGEYNVNAKIFAEDRVVEENVILQVP